MNRSNSVESHAMINQWKNVFEDVLELFYDIQEVSRIYHFRREKD